MKFLCERDPLKDALHAVMGRAKGNGTIPILSYVLLRAQSNGLTVCAHDLDSSASARIGAEISEEGAVAVPAEHFNRLVQGISSGAQVSFEMKDKQASVRSGRSKYVLPTLPAEDFPDMLAPADPIKIEITAANAVRVFAVPEPFTDTHRVYVMGVYLHRLKGKLSGVGTDGHRLVRTVADDCAAPDFHPVIVPATACKEFARLAKDAGGTLCVAKNIVSLETKDKVFASKLVDAEFPDYVKLIPMAQTPTITFDADELDAALARIEAVIDPRSENMPVVTFSWDENPATVSITMRTLAGFGDETVACECDGKPAGEVTFQLKYIRTLIDAFGGDLFRMAITAPNEVIRIEHPHDSGIIGALATCRP